MDKFKKFLRKNNAGRAAAPQDVKHVHPHSTEVDAEKFAKAVVRDYADTLVMLGKE